MYNRRSTSGPVVAVLAFLLLSFHINLLLAADAPGSALAFGRVDQQRLLNAGAEPGQWLTHGRDFNETHFSPLEDINTGNVSRLDLAWYGDFDTRQAQISTPLVIDGALYVTTAWSKVYAYDAATGGLLWRFDPVVDRSYAEFTCCGVGNRGLATWQGKLYLATLDGRLIALDAFTGEELWSVRTFDEDKSFSSTGAPRVANGKVFIGQQGAEFTERGYFSAYDADTGDLLWRWFVVPGNPANGFEDESMRRAAQTWGGEWWKLGGGGSPWDSITYDPVTNYVIIGTGNGSPWPAEIRSPGNTENLYICSIVALDADTGEYKWHYQATPHDSWDLDAAEQLTIADLRIGGRQRHVVMQAPKNGFLYMLDAVTGEFISADPLVPGINWTTGIDPETGVPAINPLARYDRNNVGFIVVPGALGSHSWYAMAFNPENRLLYIPVMLNNGAMVAAPENLGSSNALARGIAINPGKGAALMQDLKVPPRSGGYLLAWDPASRREVWRVPFSEGRGGGVLATAGNLVFQGNTYNSEFAAYRADTGEQLWSSPVHTGIGAAPVTYKVNGEQYVAVVTGSRMGGNYYADNGSRILAFKLGGAASLPPAPPEVTQVLNPPADFGTDAMKAAGGDAYGANCAGCHGINGQSRALFPDLRYSPALNSEALFSDIVTKGRLAQNGMPDFADKLTATQAENIRAYVTGLANTLQNSQ